MLKKVPKRGRDSTRGWKFSQKTKNNCNFSEIKKEIRKASEKKVGVNATKINKLLMCSNSFLGCFAENEISELSFQNFPSFLIVNLDKRGLPGSHWIGLGIFPNKVEIFDSLGFNVLNWPRIPCSLLKLLNRLAVSRRIVVSKRIQSTNSVLCGFYSMLYVLARPNLSFRKIQALFDTELSYNDSILLKLFQ